MLWLETFRYYGIKTQIHKSYRDNVKIACNGAIKLLEGKVIDFENQLRIQIAKWQWQDFIGKIGTHYTVFGTIYFIL
jgi:hypothetical protein